jgi:ATP-dependent DNA helicase RecG
VVITVGQIDEWRSLPRETDVLEFKEAKNQFDHNKLCRYCVGIANEGGGYLLLGIQDKIPHMVVGTNAFNNLPGIMTQLMDDLGFRVDVAETQHPDGRVVTLRIPGRPRATPLHYRGEYLMRSGASLVSMSPDMLKRICAENDPEWLEEYSIVNIGGARVTALLDVESYFRLINIPFSGNAADAVAQLLRDRLIIDEGLGAYSIRRIAALMLARNLQDFSDVERKAPRVIVYSGTSKLSPVLGDRTFTQGYAAGFQELVQHVLALLPHNEVIKDALRTEVKLVPEVVVRELVANALVHQDLGIGGSSVVVEIFSNRLEISNPGEPIIAVERLIDGYQSRNERLAAMMRKMRICEERGRGIDEVVRVAEILQLPAPEFRATEQRTVVTVFAHKPFKSMEREDRIRACYQHCVLKRVMTERMTNQTLRERFHLPKSKTATTVISQVIAATIEADLIKPDKGSGTSRRFAYYVPFWVSPIHP